MEYAHEKPGPTFTVEVLKGGSWARIVGTERKSFEYCKGYYDALLCLKPKPPIRVIEENEEVCKVLFTTIE